MVFRTTRRLSLRVKLSFLWAISTAILIFIGSLILLFLVMEKRRNDLENHLINISRQISSLPAVNDYFTDSPDAPSREDVEKWLEALLFNNPFIEELTLIDRFDKISFRISQLRENPLEVPPRGGTSVSIDDVISSERPIHVYDNSESYIGLGASTDSYWGTLRVRWRPEATVKYFYVLKAGVFYITFGSFLLTFFLSYFLLLRSYTNETYRMSKTLSMIVGGNFFERIDTQSYSYGFSEIGVYINRLLGQLEDEKDKSAMLDSTLRQVEKSCSEYRRSLNERSHELENLRNELRHGLQTFFDLIWSGLIVLDEEFRIHFKNDQAERLLRFARVEDSIIVDERLKKCLSPLVRTHTSKRIDDLCAWSQKSMGQSVSCRIRAAEIPSADANKLFFVLLKEESGFPKYHGSTYYSERLVLDVLANERSNAPLVLATSDQKYLPNDFEQRFRECLRKIEVFHDLEEGRVGTVSSIRLPLWLRNHFKWDDFISEYLNIDTKYVDMDITLNVPELWLEEIVDNLIMLIYRTSQIQSSGRTTTIEIHSTVDSHGKPVIAFTLPGFMRSQLSDLQDLLEERTHSFPEIPTGDAFTLDDLERELTLAIYRLVKRLLQVHIECVYSDSKKVATIRLVIENHSFDVQTDQESDKLLSSDPVKNLVREFLNGY
jgi:PAS domain-containing protein